MIERREVCKGGYIMGRSGEIDWLIDWLFLLGLGDPCGQKKTVLKIHKKQ